MVEFKVEKHYLPPTALIPNSSKPLLHYKNIIPDQSQRDHPEVINDLFDSNGWNTRWIIRYGATQPSHFHSGIHECMAVLSGTATIRFGVADTDEDLEKSTWGNAREAGGVEIEARAGDAFLVPAGVSHKTHNTSPAQPFALLTPGLDKEKDKHGALAGIELTGFTMIGSYPNDGGTLDSQRGGTFDASYLRQVWNTANPGMDPLLGDSIQGLVGQWQH